MVDWEAEGKVMPDFAKLEGQKGMGPQQEGDLPLWAARQQKVFTNWINNKVIGAISTQIYTYSCSFTDEKCRKKIQLLWLCILRSRKSYMRFLSRTETNGKS